MYILLLSTVGLYLRSFSVGHGGRIRMTLSNERLDALVMNEQNKNSVLDLLVNVALIPEFQVAVIDINE